ncbi:MAG: hypothetical protein AAF376_16030 [Pseudomonadota bacterium]
MRFRLALMSLLTLSACVPQEQVIPPDPLAPFPLRNTVIVGQPQPGVLLVEERSIIVNRARVRCAANIWCDGPASATALSDDRGDSALRIVSVTWLVRCQ